MQVSVNSTSGFYIIRRTEFVEAEDQEGFVDFEAQSFGLHQRERLAVDFDEAFAGLSSTLASHL